MADPTPARAELLEAMHAAHTALNHADVAPAQLAQALVQLDKAIVIAGEVRRRLIAAMAATSGK